MVYFLLFMIRIYISVYNKSYIRIVVKLLNIYLTASAPLMQNIFYKWSTRFKLPIDGVFWVTHLKWYYYELLGYFHKSCSFYKETELYFTQSVRKLRGICVLSILVLICCLSFKISPNKIYNWSKKKYITSQMNHIRLPYKIVTQTFNKKICFQFESIDTGI